jgi:hypothetical protein
MGRRSLISTSWSSDPVGMKRQLRLLALTSFVLSAPVVSAAQDVDQTPSPAVTQAVRAVFPQKLRYTENPSPDEESSPDYYSTCAAVFSRGADNEPSLIAAAYNGDGAEVAMLAYTPGSTEVLSAFTNEQFALGDGACGLAIDNLADSEHPNSPLARTIVVTFHDAPVWFFTWDGKKLQNITELDSAMGYWKGREVPDSAIRNADVVDIDHSGAIQLTEINGDGDKVSGEDGIIASPTKTLFRYNGDIYSPAKTLIAIQEFEPNLPQTPDELASYYPGDARWIMGIDMHQTPTRSYRLTIINGDRDGSSRVSSAMIEVDGVTIVQSTEVNENVEMLTRTIRLQKENDIKVTVDGPEKSHIYVTVE